jgi:hypothetical protein
MAYLTIQINTPSYQVGDLNSKLCQGDSTKPLEIMNNVINIINSLNGGLTSASVTLVSSTVAGTVSGQTGGVSVAFTQP